MAQVEESRPGMSVSGADAEERSSAAMIAELYGELRRLAAAKMGRLAPGQTLQATALVHEVYLRLSKEPSQRWDNRGHFFAAPDEAMRRILIEQARKKAALRPGGGSDRLSLDEVEVQAPEPEERLLEVDGVLAELPRGQSIRLLQGDILHFRDEAKEGAGLTRALFRPRSRLSISTERGVE